jgi:signal transduction histidine kinase
LKIHASYSADPNAIMLENYNINKEQIHKISISVAFGLIGFCLDLQPFVLLLPNHKFFFMAGLVFPMIVSLNWGWRYGFLSVTSGVVCQTLWVKGGWDPGVIVAMSILWIVWHGWCVGRFKSTGETKWNRYIAEIPFRIFSTIVLFVTFPAAWAPGSTEAAVSMSSASIAGLEAMVSGYLVLLLSDVLIVLEPLRKLLKLKEVEDQKRSHYLLGTCFLVACIFWVIDGASSELFRDSSQSMDPKGHGTLLDTTVFNVPLYALLRRISFFLALLFGVTLTTRYVDEHSKTGRLLRKLVELSPYPITIVDFHNHVEYINPEFVASFGYQLEDIPTATELYNKIFPNIFDRRDFMIWKEDIRSTQESRTDPRMFNVTSKDGKIVNIIFRRVVFGDDKQYIICENVSQRVRAEEKFRKLNEELEQRVIKRTAQLEATNKELEAFSYSVSHDLRAPLRSIDGFSLALIEEYEDNLDAAGKDYLTRVRSASQRMGQIIDDLLSLSRISRRELRKDEVNLSEIAERIIAKLKESDIYRDVEVVIGHRIIAHCDPNLIEVVLENLFSNAWKFTSKTPNPWIIFEERFRNGETIYSVRDNGAGFDMAYADKLFSAFQRLHKHTDFEGYGIGLATVMRIINRHEGRIWAEGNVDSGASFYFVL